MYTYGRAKTAYDEELQILLPRHNAVAKWWAGTVLLRTRIADHVLRYC